MIYRVLDQSGIELSKRDTPYTVLELMALGAMPDGAKYVSEEPSGADHTIKIRRNGVWHDWEPPLGEAQQAAYDSAMRGESVLITGPGGCGKSEVVRRIVRDLRYDRGRSVAVTGSTGVAAVNLGGTTIHSFLGTGVSNTRKEALKNMKADAMARASERIMGTDTVVIDEISMLHGDYMDMASWWMNLACGNGPEGEPFAGKQLIMVGDFLQLPPVIMPGDAIVNKYTFDAESWKALDPRYHSLLKNFRQVDDAAFRRHLLRVRKGWAPEDTLDYFNTRLNATLSGVGEPTQLFPTNKEADRVNDDKLSRLRTPEVYLPAMYAGHPKWQEALKRNLPCDDPLELKLGAEVMCTFNNMEAGYVNGTRGIVKEFCRDGVLVETRDGGTVKVVKNKWEMRNAQDTVLASVCQYPLRLAWAMTIHKSQGSTLDEMVFDPQRVFERAQAYVALSRVRSIAGLRLLSPLRAEHVRASSKVVEWYRSQRDRMAALEDAARAAAGDPDGASRG
ncbi:MAG: ATP-dependent RecD-like DNA helicase [Firmicutes bacterium ADurb.Bin506]|nr:MAG: ATP-dependent RecD-like DNA helicase [Firmicutes bacterium ADurb.Bin506]